MRLFLALLILVISCQSNDTGLNIEDPIEIALKEYISTSENIGEKLVLSFSDSTIYEIEASFIGSIKLKTSKTLKILNVIHFTGLYRDALRARGEIVIYDDQNKVLGRYEIGSKDNLPTNVLSEEKLIFAPHGDCNLKTIVDFSSGPPEKLFIECTERGGNLYQLLKRD